jgi:hypothetical protein
MNTSTYRGIRRFLFVAVFCSMGGASLAPARAESSAQTAAVDPTHGDPVMKEMADYSRPGSHHQLFAHLEGQWKFRGGFPDLSGALYHGTVAWRSFANGRFLMAEARSDEANLQVPIQDGKWQETFYRGVSLLGYDNVKKKFQMASVQNHFGSDIAFSQGDYDTQARSIVFEGEEELVPGQKARVRQCFVFRDKDHYAVRSYEMKDGAYVQTSETDYTRVPS